MVWLTHSLNNLLCLHFHLDLEGTKCIPRPSGYHGTWSWTRTMHGIWLMVIFFNTYCITHWRHITKDQMREHRQNKGQKKTIMHKRVNLMKYCEMLTFLSIADWTKMLTKFRRTLKCILRQGWFRKQFRFLFERRVLLGFTVSYKVYCK